MADGSTKNIEEIHIGDHVLAYDTDTQKVVASTVSETFVHTDAAGMTLINGTLRATVNHLFYANGAFVRADELRPGDALVSIAGRQLGAQPMSTRSAKVQSLVGLPGHETVYNLEVDGQHNYFAGGLLVHNKPPY
jgi:intein/homing endonuclease